MHILTQRKPLNIYDGEQPTVLSVKWDVIRCCMCDKHVASILFITSHLFPPFSLENEDSTRIIHFIYSRDVVRSHEHKSVQCLLQGELELVNFG